MQKQKEREAELTGKNGISPEHQQRSKGTKIKVNRFRDVSAKVLIGAGIGALIGYLMSLDEDSGLRKVLKMVIPDRAKIVNMGKELGEEIAEVVEE